MAEPRRHPNVINISEAESETQEGGKRFQVTTRPLAAFTGASGIGCTWHEVLPGKTAWPRHFHCANEEALFVLEGQGTLRIGDDTVPIRAGDYATFPVGPRSAHQVQNTGTAPLRYLAMSTLITAEVVGYPDSRKFGAMAWPSYEAAIKGESWVRVLVREGSGPGYYEGEDLG